MERDEGQKDRVEDDHMVDLFAGVTSTSTLVWHSCTRTGSTMTGVPSLRQWPVPLGSLWTLLHI